MNRFILVVLLFACLSFVLADDLESGVGFGGDEEMRVGYIGDLELGFYGNYTTNVSSIETPVVETPIDSTPVATSGGGGGGGSGSVASVTGDFSISEDSLVVRSVVGDLRTRRFIVKNSGKNLLPVSLSVEGMDVEDEGGNIKSFDKVVVLSDDSFILGVGEEKEIELKIIVPDSLGVHTGKIIVNSNKEILITINTQSKETIFDISSTLLEDNLVSGEKFKTQIYLLPVGEKGVDVTLKYSIRDYAGKIYYEESGTFYVDKEMSFTKEFSTDDLLDGNYVLAVEMVYIGGFASASSQFKISQTFEYGDFFQRNIYLILLVFGIIFVFVFVLIKLIQIRKYKKLKKK